MSYESNQKNLMKAVNRLLERNMIRATAHAQGEIVDLISRSQPTKRSGQKMRGLSPSRPGQPPKVIAGLLRNNVSYQVKRNINGVSGFVGIRKGVADGYGLYLELGTSKMEPRPYIRRVVIGDRKIILRIIATGKRI